jgi:hypothetical protein
MNRETRIIIGVTLGTIALFIGAVILMSGTSSEGTSAPGGDRFVSNVQAQGLSASPDSIDIGKVSYGGGIVSKVYEIQNTTGDMMKLRKIVTSCMCTKARVQFDDKTTKFYSMEMNGDKNPIINYDFQAGSSAKVEFNFDPAAHGPAGIGPVDRVITLYFDGGFKELKFSGEVVK